MPLVAYSLSSVKRLLSSTYYFLTRASGDVYAGLQGSDTSRQVTTRPKARLALALVEQLLPLVKQIAAYEREGHHRPFCDPC